VLTPSDVDYLLSAMDRIKALVQEENCPPVIKAKICKSCSYYEFCYIQD
jgi:CRISPR-associated exonuclease Cas4